MFAPRYTQYRVKLPLVVPVGCALAPSPPTLRQWKDRLTSNRVICSQRAELR